MLAKSIQKKNFKLLVFAFGGFSGGAGLVLVLVLLVILGTLLYTTIPFQEDADIEIFIPLQITLVVAIDFSKTRLPNVIF